MTYFRHPIEPNLCTYTLPNLSNIVTNLPYPNDVLHYVHITLLPLKQICVLIPCPTLVILFTNLPYPNGVPHYLHISLLPLNQNCVLIPCPT